MKQFRIAHFDESKKHFAEHVFTLDHGSILINKEEAVLNQSKDVDTGENIEDYDSNTRVENFVGHVHNAGFNFPSAEVGINGTDTSKISTEEFLFKDVVNEESIDQDDDSNIKRENLVDNVNVVFDYPLVFERNNEELVADSLNNLDSFKIHSENLIEDIHEEDDEEDDNDEDDDQRYTQGSEEDDEMMSRRKLENPTKKFKKKRVVKKTMTSARKNIL